MLLQESIGKERRPLSWVVGDQGVYRANMQSEKERKRGERIAVTNLRSWTKFKAFGPPGAIFAMCCVH